MLLRVRHAKKDGEKGGKVKENKRKEKEKIKIHTQKMLNKWERINIVVL
jgi:hypothetical protein